MYLYGERERERARVHVHQYLYREEGKKDALLHHQEYKRIKLHKEGLASLGYSEEGASLAVATTKQQHYCAREARGQRPVKVPLVPLPYSTSGSSSSQCCRLKPFSPSASCSRPSVYIHSYTVYSLISSILLLSLPLYTIVTRFSVALL